VLIQKIVMKDVKRYEVSAAKLAVCSTSNMINKDSVNLIVCCLPYWIY